MTDTNIETNTPQIEYIGAFNWKEFQGNGKVKHLWSAGILNSGFKPEMLSIEGYVKTSENKKENKQFGVVYDEFYVYESICKQLKALGIIQDGKVNRDLMGILFNKLADYTDGFANRVNETSLMDKAKDLAKQFPGVGDENHWYQVLSDQVNKAETEKDPDESEPTSTKTVSAKTTKAKA